MPVGLFREESPCVGSSLQEMQHQASCIRSQMCTMSEQQHITPTAFSGGTLEGVEHAQPAASLEGFTMSEVDANDK